MKKRIRNTGEIDDVVSFNNLYSSEIDRVDSVSYIDSEGNCFNVVGPNLEWDFEDVEEELNTEIDCNTSLN